MTNLKLNCSRYCLSSIKRKKVYTKTLFFSNVNEAPSGSSKVIDILNGLGHCISHSSVLEYDTALAEMRLQTVDSLPIGLKHNLFTTLVWDNIDFSEETNWTWHYPQHKWHCYSTKNKRIH